jgi:hypothetical protein
MLVAITINNKKVNGFLLRQEAKPKRLTEEGVRHRCGRESKQPILTLTNRVHFFPAPSLGLYVAIDFLVVTAAV